MFHQPYKKNLQIWMALKTFSLRLIHTHQLNPILLRNMLAVNYKKIRKLNLYNDQYFRLMNKNFRIHTCKQVI